MLFAALMALALLQAVALPDRALAQDASVVQVDKIRTEPLDQTVPVVGRLVATQTGAVAAEIDGIVEVIHAEVGDKLNRGQAIATVDVEIYKARHDLARGELNQSIAELKTARAEVKLARQAVERLEGLRKSGAFPKGRFDDALQQVRVNEAKVARAEALVATRQASLALAALNLDRTEITAPYDGVVTERRTEVGAYVKSGDAVAVMIATGTLEVEADVPFRRIGALKAGSKVTVVLDDGTRHSATVRAVLPSENPMTRTRAVRFVPQFGDRDIALADAQSATVHIPVGDRRDVVTVHKDAIINRNGRNLVFVVADNAAQPRPVQLGEAVGSRLVVRGGLKEGEQVVIRGNERLMPGAKVRVDTTTQ